MLHTLYVIAIVVGIFSVAAAVVLVLAAHIVKHYKPEDDSNEALKNWLLSHPGADIDDYLHNKSDRCVIQ